MVLALHVPAYSAISKKNADNKRKKVYSPIKDTIPHKDFEHFLHWVVAGKLSFISIIQSLPFASLYAIDEYVHCKQYPQKRTASINIHHYQRRDRIKSGGIIFCTKVTILPEQISERQRAGMILTCFSPSHKRLLDRMCLAVRYIGGLVKEPREMPRHCERMCPAGPWGADTR